MLSPCLDLSSLSAVDTGEKHEEGGIENVSSSVYSRMKRDECLHVVSSCDKRELIEMLLSNKLILKWVLIFSEALLLSSGKENFYNVCQYLGFTLYCGEKYDGSYERDIS